MSVYRIERHLGAATEEAYGTSRYLVFYFVSTITGFYASYLWHPLGSSVGSSAGFFGLQACAFALLGAYLIVFLGERPNPGSKLAGKIGDCSYGLYLYAWPAEQILRQFTGTTSPFWLFLGALPLAWTLAFLSCHLIERPAMKRRGAVAALMRSAFNKLFKGVRAPAVIGAKIVFVVGALLMLTRGPYWLITWNMGKLLVLMMAGSAIAVVTHRLGVRVGLWHVPRP